MATANLKELLLSNVVELKFPRRNPKPGQPTTRRMLASLDYGILNSPIGRKVFNFNLPGTDGAYNANRYNLLVVFDLFMQNWRAIPTENISIIRTFPESEFWDYFNDVLSKMTADQKAAFMNTP